MLVLSLVEKVLLAGAIAASGYFFWLRFGSVLKIIQSTRKDVTFELGDVARRVWTFVWEVILQAKVIQQRPLPGLAHAFVFWGFCAFGLVTLNHFALGFGLELLSPSGFFGRIYFAMAALFAVAVAVSIFALAFRRFVLQPRWLGKVSYESGFIALLIFTLMWTYLADYVMHAQDPAWSETWAARVIWWLHSASILTFLPLIPHTKHLHLI
ncbi:MAG: [Fe-S]-binding protein, partial [Bryobacterales bacterium]|nr:[Fe-S]-binding protein [Bryobacterales bacterium]